MYEKVSDKISEKRRIIIIMLAYLYCTAYTRMTMNRGALQSQMSKASLKRCVLRHVLNLVVSDIDLSSFR